MAATVYRIKTARPMLWRTPESLQVGVDHPRVELHHLSAQIAPLLHALHEGISREGLFLLARSMKVEASEVERILKQLAPTYEEDIHAPIPIIGLTGSSRATGHIGGVLAGLGMDVRRAARAEDLISQGTHGLALVADYLAHPEWVTALTRFDIAHTPVLFSDRYITVGPVVRPGSSPCLSCLEAERRQADPEWLNIGTQLWSETSPLSDRRGALLAAQLLGMLWGVPEWRGLVPELAQPGAHLRLDPINGKLSIARTSFDPECRCRGL